MPRFEQSKPLNERWSQQQAECEALLAKTEVKGSIVRVDDDAEGVNPNYVGMYLSLDEIPAFKPHSNIQAICFNDQDTYDLVRETRAEGVPIFFKPGTSLLDAAHIPAEHPLERALNREKQSPESIIIISPETDYFRLKHELQHYGDNKQNIKKQILAEIEKLPTALQIEDAQRQHIIRFIIEQRAHFQEALALSTENVKGRSGAPEIRVNNVTRTPFLEFYNRRKSRIKEELLEYYGARIEATLNQWRTEDPETYSAIKNIIKKYTFSNPNIPEFNLEQLLTSHFN